MVANTKHLLIHFRCAHARPFLAFSPQELGGFVILGSFSHVLWLAVAEVKSSHILQLRIQGSIQGSLCSSLGCLEQGPEERPDQKPKPQQNY